MFISFLSPLSIIDSKMVSSLVFLGLISDTTILPAPSLAFEVSLSLTPHIQPFSSFHTNFDGHLHELLKLTYFNIIFSFFFLILDCLSKTRI